MSSTMRTRIMSSTLSSCCFGTSDGGEVTPLSPAREEGVEDRPVDRRVLDLLRTGIAGVQRTLLVVVVRAKDEGHRVGCRLVLGGTVRLELLGEQVGELLGLRPVDLDHQQGRGRGGRGTAADTHLEDPEVLEGKVDAAVAR